MIILFSLFMLGSLICDGFAIHLLMSQYDLYSVLLWHGIAIILILTSIYFIRKSYQHFYYPIFLLLFLLTLLLPFLGIFACILIIRMLYITQLRYQRVGVKQVSVHTQITPARSRYGIGGLYKVIKTTDASLETRITAFKTLSSISPEKINHLVRSMLPDKQEELRLLAFYLLNKQETILVNDISKSIDLLKKINQPSLIAKLHKWLALQYWELIYKKLIDADLIDHIMNQVLHHVNIAQTMLPNDPSLLLLQGKIQQQKGEYTKAIALFNQAIQLGGLFERIAPYIAEAYFKQKNFKALKEYTRKTSAAFINQVSHHLFDFWKEKHG